MGERERGEGERKREERWRGGKEVRHTHNWVNLLLAAKKILCTLPYRHQHTIQLPKP